MASNRANDEIEIKKDGQIRLRIDGESYLLRRPKIGELRRLEEATDALAVQERDEKIAAKAEERPPRPMTDEILDWWRDVVETLEQKDQTLPVDNDDLPAWLASPQLLGDARLTWRTVPWGPGGQPTR